MRGAIVLFFGVLTSCATLQSQTRLPLQDIRSVREAISVHGNAIWEGWSQDDLAVLLVAADTESLLCAAPQRDFTAAGIEPVTGCTLQERPTSLPLDIAATVEFGGVTIAALGLPGADDADRSDWMLTAAHEMFHGWQMRQPGYNAALDDVIASLAPADAPDGSWMLDYPFPYDERETTDVFAPMSSAAIEYLSAHSDFARRNAISSYLEARRSAATRLGGQFWTYYEFQAGQEGVARWTELALAERLAATDAAFVDAATGRRAGLATSLRAIDRDGMGLWNRSIFYVYGAIEADMLSYLDPSWRSEYGARPFVLGAHLEEALRPS